MSQRIGAIRSQLVALGDHISHRITVLCIVTFLLLSALDLFGVVPWAEAVEVLGVSWVGVVHRLWVHQLVTAPLLHGHATHLAFNMLSLWMLGPGVEAALGRARYVSFTIVCALASMGGFLLVHPGAGVVVYGYSGVVFGLLVAQARLFPDDTLWVYALFPLPMRYAVLLLGTIELYLTVVPGDAGIANAAHLCGGLAAWAFFALVGSGGTPRRHVAATAGGLDAPGDAPREVPWEL